MFNTRNDRFQWGHFEDLRFTFSDKCVPVSPSQGAVDLADNLHVVEESVEGIEVGEAHHVGGAPSCSLQEDTKFVISSHLKAQVIYD